MKVVLISDNGNYHKKLTINVWFQLLLPILILVAGIAIVKNIDPLFFSSGIQSSKQASQSDDQAYKNFNVVLTKLGVLDAEVQRLNTLSAHIASKNTLNIDDYNLANAPARGGVIVNNTSGSTIIRKKDINNNITNIEVSLSKQKLRLRNLVTSLEIKEAEEYLTRLSKRLIAEKPIKSPSVVYDFSTPLKDGYISSSYGYRKDPINGSLRHHNGLDIAANKGSNVYAIANGFISFSGKKGAYGNLVEINHSESLKSRYAHLDVILSKKGQVVRKGDLIGEVGSTGRVTGPHLHLEIKENNKIINPKSYLSDALKNL